MTTRPAFVIGRKMTHSQARCPVCHRYMDAQNRNGKTVMLFHWELLPDDKIGECLTSKPCDGVGMATGATVKGSAP